MTVVWKYALYITDRQFFDMPAGAELLHAAVHDGLPFLWAKVDPDAPRVSRAVEISGTGNPCPVGAAYIGTLLMDEWVWHVWDGA